MSPDSMDFRSIWAENAKAYAMLQLRINPVFVTIALLYADRLIEKIHFHYHESIMKFMCAPSLPHAGNPALILHLPGLTKGRHPA
jgi:hypothetical protein